MTGRIFISYRRVDSQFATDQIYSQLVGHFGNESVFMDIDTIPLGVNFREYIDQQISTSDIVLAVIGDHWLTTTDSDGNIRLHNPNDFVRLEIEAALKQGIKLIPLYIGGVQNLPADKLPDSLKELPMLNATRIRRSTDFLPDVERLIRGIERIREEQAEIRAHNKTALESIDQALPKLPVELEALEDLSIAERRQQKTLLETTNELADRVSYLLSDPAQYLRVDIAALRSEIRAIENELFNLNLAVEERQRRQALTAAQEADTQAEEARWAALRRENQAHLKTINGLLAEILAELTGLSGLTLKERRKQASLKRSGEMIVRSIQRILDSPDDLLSVEVSIYEEQLEQLQTELFGLTADIDERKIKEAVEEESGRQAKAEAQRKAREKAEQQRITQQKPAAQHEARADAERFVRETRSIDGDALQQDANGKSAQRTSRLKDTTQKVTSALKKVPVWGWVGGGVIVLAAIFGPLVWGLLSSAFGWNSTPTSAFPDVSGTQAANATAVAGIDGELVDWINQITAASPDYIEDFSTPQSSWPTDWHIGGYATYYWGRLQINRVPEEATTYPLKILPGTAGDFIYEFEFTPYDFGYGGLINIQFRQNPEGHYSFVVQKDGSWELGLTTSEGYHVLLSGITLEMENERTYKFGVYAWSNQIMLMFDDRIMGFVEDDTYSEGEIELRVGSYKRLSIDLDNFHFWDLADLNYLETPVDDQSEAFYTPIREYLADNAPTFEEDFETPQDYWYGMDVNLDPGEDSSLSEFVSDGYLFYDSVRDQSDPDFGLIFSELHANAAVFQYDFTILNAGLYSGLNVMLEPREQASEGSSGIFLLLDLDTSLKEGYIFWHLSQSGSGDADWVDVGNGHIPQTEDMPAANTLLLVYQGSKLIVFLNGYTLGYFDGFAFEDQQVALFPEIGDGLSFQVDNVKFWNLNNYSDGLQPSATPTPTQEPNIAELVLTYLDETTPDFADDFSEANSEWGLDSTGAMITSDIQPDGSLRVVDLYNQGEVSFPVNGLFDAKNFALSFDINWDQNSIGAFGLVVRKAPTSFYKFKFSYSELAFRQAWLYSNTQGEETRTTDSGWFDLNESNHILVTVYQNNLIVFVNDELVFADSETDDTEMFGEGNHLFGGSENITWDNIQFWNLDGVDLRENDETSGGDSSPDYEYILDYVENELSPTFEDDFSQADMVWGVTSEGLAIWPLVQNGELLISDHVEEVDMGADHAVPGLTFPTNGLFDAHNFLLEFDYYYETDHPSSEIGIHFRSSSDLESGYKIFTIPEGTWTISKNGETFHQVMTARKSHRISLLVVDQYAVVVFNGQMPSIIEGIDDIGTSNRIWMVGGHGSDAVFDNVQFWNLDDVEFSQ